MVVKRLHIVLTTRFLVFVKLTAHEQLGLLHPGNTNTHNRTIKVNDLHQVSICRYFVGLCPVAIKEVFLIGLDIHDVITVEIIVRKSIIPLGKREGKYDLRHPCCMLVRFRICLD